MTDMTTDALELYCRNLSKAKNDLTEYDRALLMDVSAKLCDLQRRIAEDDKAREEGRLVELPCKVGDTVYEPYGDYVKSWKVEAFEVGADMIPRPGYYVPFEGFSAYSVGTGDWNAVFPTRQEAEAALDGGGRDG